jgi:hypothetical protein
MYEVAIFIICAVIDRIIQNNKKEKRMYKGGAL